MTPFIINIYYLLTKDDKILSYWNSFPFFVSRRFNRRAHAIHGFKSKEEETRIGSLIVEFAVMRLQPLLQSSERGKCDGKNAGALQQPVALTIWLAAWMHSLGVSSIFCTKIVSFTCLIGWRWWVSVLRWGSLQMGRYKSINCLAVSHAPKFIPTKAERQDLHLQIQL